MAPCFEKYVIELEKQGNLRGKNLNFKKTGFTLQTMTEERMWEVAPFANGIGAYGHKSPHIWIVESMCTSDTAYSFELEQLIFHEYGHSGLRRNHLCGAKSDNFAESIMYGTLGNSSTTGCPSGLTVDYTNQRKYYLDELFKEIPESLLINF